MKEQQNLLKVRDGIIGIMKSKKDVTLSEYDQLREYVNDLMHQYNEVSSTTQDSWKKEKFNGKNLATFLGKFKKSAENRTNWWVIHITWV